MNRNTKPRIQCLIHMFCTTPCTLTIVLDSISLRLRLKRTKSNFASIAQDPALSVSDLDSVDL